MIDKAFCITDNKGFRLTFSNGWAISVQWGPGNYGDNCSAPFDSARKDTTGFYSSNKAEVAIIKDGTWSNVDGDDVAGYVSADRVGELIGLLASGQYQPK